MRLEALQKLQRKLQWQTHAHGLLHIVASFFRCLFFFRSTSFLGFFFVICFAIYLLDRRLNETQRPVRTLRLEWQVIGEERGCKMSVENFTYFLLALATSTNQPWGSSLQPQTKDTTRKMAKNAAALV